MERNSAETGLLHGRGLTNGMSGPDEADAPYRLHNPQVEPVPLPDLIVDEPLPNLPVNEPKQLRKMMVVKALGAADDNVASEGSGLTKGPDVTERRSFTTGVISVNGKGLTAGWGMINGTGMTREAGFHQREGRFNGSGSRVSCSLASAEGMTNGSGLTHGTDMAPDTGMTNGCGLTHGTGMTNGCGLVKEPGPIPMPEELPSPKRRRLRGFLPFL
jgi:hypothetical protein